MLGIGSYQNRVVVGVDGSLASLTALRAAVSQARCRRAELRIVHVHKPVSTVFRLPSPGQSMSQELLDEILAADRRALNMIQSWLVRALGEIPEDLSIDPVVTTGQPALALCEYVRNERDLLVIGTREGRRWHHPGRPSVSKYCLKHAPCPVLVVPCDSFARSAYRSGSEHLQVPRDPWREFEATA